MSKLKQVMLELDVKYGVDGKPEVQAGRKLNKKAIGKPKKDSRKPYDVDKALAVSSVSQKPSKKKKSKTKNRRAGVPAQREPELISRETVSSNQIDQRAALSADIEEQRRMIRRQIEARRRRRKKRQFRITVLLAAILALITGLVLSMTVFFNVEEIVVTGNSKYSKDEIIVAARMSIGDNLVRMGEGSIRDRITSEYEYVDDVEVIKEYPNKVTLKIKEAKPVISAMGKYGYVVLSEKNRVLMIRKAIPIDGTMLLFGVDLSGYQVGDYVREDGSDELENYRMVREECDKLGLGPITKLKMDTLADIRITLGDRIRIDVGNIKDLDYKLTFAKKLLDEHINENEKGIIDIRQGSTAYFRVVDDIS